MNNPHHSNQWDGSNPECNPGGTPSETPDQMVSIRVLAQIDEAILLAERLVIDDGTGRKGLALQHMQLARDLYRQICEKNLERN